MKTATVIFLFCCFTGSVIAQTNGASFKDWFIHHVKVSNSMQSLDLSEQPAQFQLTFPRHDSASYLVNAGIAVILNQNTAVNFISALNIEYHRNTLTGARQNNFSLGYGYKWLFLSGDNTGYFMTGDFNYVYNGINFKNSAAGTFLFTLYRDGKRLNWNTNNFRLNNRLLFNLGPFAGFQIQDAFKTAGGEKEEIILRPLFRVNALLALCRKEGPPFDKIAALFCNYTGRTDLLNSTGARENYTQLLQAGMNYYLAYSPFEVSLGASFNDGSDPLNGLPRQQYWLVSLNFLK